MNRRDEASTSKRADDRQLLGLTKEAAQLMQHYTEYDPVLS